MILLDEIDTTRYMWHPHLKPAQFQQWLYDYVLWEVFHKTKIDFKLDLTTAGHSCHWLLALLVSQLWSLDNIFSFNSELQKM